VVKLSIEPNEKITDGGNLPDDSGDQGGNIFEKFFETIFNLEIFFLG